MNEAVSVGVLTSTEIRQVIQGLTVSLLPPEEVGVLDPVSHRIKFRFSKTKRRLNICHIQTLSHLSLFNFP